LEQHTETTGPWRILPTPSGRLIHAPKRSTSTFRDDQWGYDVEVSLEEDDSPLVQFVNRGLPKAVRLGAFRCSAITIRPRGKALTGSLLRSVPTSQLIKSAFLAAIEVGTIDDEGKPQFAIHTPTWLKSDPHADAEAIALLLRPATRPRSRGRRNILSDDQLVEVARVYRDNVHSRNPTQAVAHHFHLSHSTAARAVRRARNAGLLGPAVERRPGEARSSKAQPRDARAEPSTQLRLDRRSETL
jgi:hypothetical protein